jgi:hypothetical protein
MTTFLRVSDGTELLNVAHIASFKIGHRESVSIDEADRAHSIGYRLAETARMETLVAGLTEAEAGQVLGALAKAITKATEHGAVIDPEAIAEQHVRSLQPA